MVSLLRRILRTGRVAERAPGKPYVAPVQREANVEFSGGAMQVRQVNAGSCNGCEIEIDAAFGPVHDTQRYGARLVASPRHADALMVTGPVTRNMTEPLRRTHEAMPAPKRVIAVGDCARDCGVFRGAYGVTGAAKDVVPVDVEVPGCPPPPEAITAALRELTGR